MTAIQLNNLWTYIQGMALKQSDREWLAGKLLEPTADDAKTAQKKEYVKESFYRHSTRWNVPRGKDAS